VDCRQGQHLDCAKQRKKWALFLPQGASGAMGLQGMQGIAGPVWFIWQDPWSSSATYKATDMVLSGGSDWIATVPATGSVPATNSTAWSLFLPIGIQGLTGVPGALGLTGATGATGTTGVGFPGKPGRPGDAGAQGPAGPAGPPGAPGGFGGIQYPGSLPLLSGRDRAALICVPAGQGLLTKVGLVLFPRRRDPFRPGTAAPARADMHSGSMAVDATKGMIMSVRRRQLLGRITGAATVLLVLAGLVCFTGAYEGQALICMLLAVGTALSANLVGPRPLLAPDRAPRGRSGPMLLSPTAPRPDRP
jgi:hypothetical protein